MDEQRQTRRINDAPLWKVYLADRSDANRNAIFDVFWPWMHNTAMRRMTELKINDKNQRDEILSDVSTYAILVAIPKYRPEIGRFRGYMAQRIKFVLSEFVRRHKRASQQSNDWLIQEMPSDETQENWVNDDLINGISWGLKPRTLEILRDHFLNGTSTLEISKRLRLTERRVEQLIVGAKKIMKKAFRQSAVSKR